MTEEKSALSRLEQDVRKFIKDRKNMLSKINKGKIIKAYKEVNKFGDAKTIQFVTQDPFLYHHEMNIKIDTIYQFMYDNKEKYDKEVSNKSPSMKLTSYSLKPCHEMVMRLLQTNLKTLLTESNFSEIDQLRRYTKKMKREKNNKRADAFYRTASVLLDAVNCRKQIIDTYFTFIIKYYKFLTKTIENLDRS